MAVRGVVIPIDGKHALDLHAGRLEIDEYHRLLPVDLGGWVSLAHEDRDLATRVACAGRPPLSTIDHIVIAVSPNRCLDIGRVRRGDIGFSHQKGGTNFTLHEWL